MIISQKENLQHLAPQLFLNQRQLCTSSFQGRRFDSPLNDERNSFRESITGLIYKLPHCALRLCVANITSRICFDIVDFGNDVFFHTYVWTCGAEEYSDSPLCMPLCIGLWILSNTPLAFTCFHSIQSTFSNCQGHAASPVKRMHGKLQWLPVDAFSKCLVHDSKTVFIFVRVHKAFVARSGALWAMSQDVQALRRRIPLTFFGVNPSLDRRNENVKHFGPRATLPKDWGHNMDSFLGPCVEEQQTQGSFDDPSFFQNLRAFLGPVCVHSGLHHGIFSPSTVRTVPTLGK